MKLRLLTSVLVLFFSTKWQRAEARVALVGDSVELVRTDNCPDGAKLMTGDNKVVVAEKVNGTWIGKGPYDGRIGKNTSSSVVLAGVWINDRGLYESTCGDTRVNLEVVAAGDKSVREGEQVRLNCHLNTDASVTLVKWEKDGALVINITASSLNGNRTGFERGRVSVSPDCFRTGNFSLSIERVRKEDAGVYRCFIAEKTRGVPAAVRMEVTNQTTAVPDCVSTPHPPHADRP